MLRLFCPASHFRVLAESALRWDLLGVFCISLYMFYFRKPLCFFLGIWLCFSSLVSFFFMFSLFEFVFQLDIFFHRTAASSVPVQETVQHPIQCTTLLARRCTSDPYPTYNALCSLLHLILHVHATLHPALFLPLTMLRCHPQPLTKSVLHKKCVNLFHSDWHKAADHAQQTIKMQSKARDISDNAKASAQQTTTHWHTVRRSSGMSSCLRFPRFAPKSRHIARKVFALSLSRGLGRYRVLSLLAEAEKWQECERTTQSKTNLDQVGLWTWSWKPSWD